MSCEQTCRLRGARTTAAIVVASLILAGQSPLLSGQSLIISAAGKACQTDAAGQSAIEDLALQRVRQDALAQAAVYLSSEGLPPDAQVEILEKSRAEWGDGCCSITARAEILLPGPAADAGEATAAPAPRTRGVVIKAKSASPPPAIPAGGAAKLPQGLLSIRAWTDKPSYRSGEKMTITLTGNKPFYARVVYHDAGGGLVQLLPNPNRTDNYFPPGTYVIPANDDTFELEIGPPFGSEEIVVYASTTPLGHVDTEPAGGVYLVATNYADVGIKTRGVGGTKKISSNQDGTGSATPAALVASVTSQGTAPRVTPAVSEFCEASVGITTHP